jgi:hypothetical protein
MYHAQTLQIPYLKKTKHALGVASEKLKVTRLVPVYQLLYTVYLIVATKTEINSFTNAKVEKLPGRSIMPLVGAKQHVYKSYRNIVPYLH